MRSVRQHNVALAVARALSFAGDFLVPESVLKADAARLVVPRATETELADAIRYHDEAKRLTSDVGEVEISYKLNATGRAWLAENR